MYRYRSGTVLVPAARYHLTAHPPFSTTVKIPQIYGSLQIRCTLTVEDSLPYFYPSSTSCLPCLPPRVDNGCQDVYLPLPFYLLSTSLPPVYLSTSRRTCLLLPSSSLPLSLPPVYRSTSRLPLYLPSSSTSRLPSTSRVYVYPCLPLSLPYRVFV